MNNSIYLIILSLVILSSTACNEFDMQPKQMKTYYGIQENEQGITLQAIDIKSGKASTFAKINKISDLQKGVYTYDSKRDFLILGTAKGVSVIDVRSSEVKREFEGITEVEYDRNSDRICGLSFDEIERQWYYVHADHLEGSIRRVKKLTYLLKVSQGSATFDYKSNRYIFNSDRGLHVLDASTGELEITLQGVTNTEFNERTGMLIGLKTNDLRKIVKINPKAQQVTEIAEIAGIGGVVVGMSAFDSDNGYYVLETNYGITAISYETGDLVASFRDILQLVVLDKIIPEIESAKSY